MTPRDPTTGLPLDDVRTTPQELSDDAYSAMRMLVFVGIGSAAVIIGLVAKWAGV